MRSGVRIQRQVLSLSPKGFTKITSFTALGRALGIPEVSVMRVCPFSTRLETSLNLETDTTFIASISRPYVHPTYMGTLILTANELELPFEF
jgi:hypothetical protein